MKTLLIIDLPDDTNLDDICIVYQIHEFKNKHDKISNKLFGTDRVRPLPEKKEDLNLDDWVTGFNDCLDEILGGTE